MGKICNMKSSDFQKIEDYVKRFSEKDILLIEKKDPQYKALELLYGFLNDKILFFRLVLINSLLSYQLNMKGEKYWELFSDFFSTGKSLDDFPLFLKLHNYRILNAKLKRFQKVKNVIDSAIKSEEDIKSLANDLKKFLDIIAISLNQKRDAKTVVFAVKMFIYAFRIAFCKDIFAPCGIMIPLDSRISKISEDKDFWRKLEKETGIPLLHIDAVLWLSDNHRLFSEE